MADPFDLPMEIPEAPDMKPVTKLRDELSEAYGVALGLITQVERDLKENYLAREWPIVWDWSVCRVSLTRIDRAMQSAKMELSDAGEWGLLDRFAEIKIKRLSEVRESIYAVKERFDRLHDREVAELREAGALVRPDSVN